MYWHLRVLCMAGALWCGALGLGLHTIGFRVEGLGLKELDELGNSCQRCLCGPFEAPENPFIRVRHSSQISWPDLPLWDRGFLQSHIDLIRGV